MHQRLVVALDIDGTQSGVPAWDESSYALRSTLNEMRARGEAFVIHNTGRPYPWRCHGDVDERFLNPIIADADVIISHAGTVVWQPSSGKLVQDQDWRNKILQQIKPEAVMALKDDLGTLGIALHPECHDSDNEFKISCLIGRENQVDIARRVTDFIADKYQGAFDVYYWNGSTLDITPRNINKTEALQYVITSAGLAGHKVLAAGDALNDLPVLNDPRYDYRVLVGNATADLKSRITSTGSGLYIASNDSPCAQGVLSALRHFGFIGRDTASVTSLATSRYKQI